MARRLKKARSNCVMTPSEGSFSAWYFEHRLPIAPERYGEILADDRQGGRPPRTATAGKRILDARLALQGTAPSQSQGSARLQGGLKDIAGGAEMIARGLAAYRAGPDRPAQTLALHHLLERQHYKLGHWRLASSDINYRRFFDVNTLAGLRVEDAGTFDAVHRLVSKLIAEGKLQGLRLDHIDGLRDPAQYFQRLRRLIREAQGNDRRDVLCRGGEDPRRARKLAVPSPASRAPPVTSG